MTFTIILAMMFGATVGAAIMAGFNNHSFNKGFYAGRDMGYELGNKEGFEEACGRIVAFPKREEGE